MKCRALVLAFVVAAIACSLAQTMSRFTVEGPTVIAFFVAGDHVNDNDADANEVFLATSSSTSCRQNLR